MNLVESHFNVMRRMSAVHFEQVTSWDGAKLAHERFVTDYNAQPHWAHRHRTDQAEVLGWTTVQRFRSPEQLHHIFYATRSLRQLARLGYTHFRRWKLYGEATLARKKAVIWVHGEALMMEYQETPLSQYTVKYDPDKFHFTAVTISRRFVTPYESPQSKLWELDDTYWKLAKPLPKYAKRKPRKRSAFVQTSLPVETKEA